MIPLIKPDPTKLPLAGGVMTGAITIADIAAAITSGNYAAQFKSGQQTVTSDAFVFDTSVTHTTGKIIKFSNNGVERLSLDGRAGTSGGGLAINGHAAVGENASIDQYSLFSIAGAMTPPSSVLKAGLDFTIDVTNSAVFSNSAALNGQLNVLGSGLLPFPSGLVFEVKNKGTSSWGANEGTNGTPTVISANYATDAGATGTGNYCAVYMARLPIWAGGAPTKIAAFEALAQGGYIGTVSVPNTAYGFVARDMAYGNNIPDTSVGVFIYKQNAVTNAHGLLIQGEELGADAVFGANKNFKVYANASAGHLEASALALKAVLVAIGDPSSLGSEMVVNGSFATDTDWTKGTGWSISGGQALKHTAGVGTLTQVIGGFVAGQAYRLTYTLTNVNSTNDTADVSIFGATFERKIVSGTYSHDFVATSTSGTITFTPSNTISNFEVDDVSIKPLGPADLVVSGKATVHGDMTVGGAMTHTGSVWGVFGSSGTQPTALTSPLTHITHTGPSTPDYAIAAPVDSGVGSSWGFSTQDEFETFASVVLNLQTRLDELETKIKTLGVLP